MIGEEGTGGEEDGSAVVAKDSSEAVEFKSAPWSPEEEGPMSGREGS